MYILCEPIILPIVLWVWNLVSHLKKTNIENVWEQGAEENVWT
jgi:hypothetical protein